MQPWCKWLGSGVFLVLAGCASDKSPTGASGGRVMLGPRVQIQAIAPSEFGYQHQVAQVLVMRFGTQTINLEAQLAMGKDEFRAILLDSLGRRAVTLVWRDGKLESQLAEWLPPGVRAEAILADMMVLYGQPAALKATLQEAGCTLEASTTARLVRCGEKDVLKAEFDLKSPRKLNGSLRYTNFAWGYDVEIQSVEVRR